MEWAVLWIWWLILSLATYACLEIYLVIRARMDEDNITGIKIRRSRKRRIRSVLGKLIFVFSISGLAFIVSELVNYIESL